MFDVFLSSTKHTWKIFTCHLETRLRRSSISTCPNEGDSEKRDSSLLSEFSYIRIEPSKIAVVVVSERYLSSAWCMNELQTILDFHDHGRLRVLPVFYNVNFLDIRSQTGTVAEAFKNLREIYPEKVQAWRISLTKLTNIPGLDLHHLSGESEMLKAITTKVQAMLSDSDITSNQSLTLTDPLTTKVSELLGFDRHMKALYKLLDLHISREEVRLIGIWGPQGVGKTMLARFAYEDLCNKFCTHMFVDNADSIYYQDPVKSRTEKTLTSGVQKGTRKKTKGEVITNVIKSMVGEGTQDKSKGQASTASKSTVGEGTQKKPKGQASTTSIKSNVGEGTQDKPMVQQESITVKSTVEHRKSLVMIDCVDKLEQLKTAAEIVGWCGSGSRVIVITHDKNLLDQFGVEHVYEVMPLRYDEALQLFSISAFETQYPPASFESLSLRAVQIASFLPLATKILGSFLKDKSKEEWEIELQKLEGDQEKTIMKIMKKTEDDKDQIPSFVFK